MNGFDWAILFPVIVKWVVVVGCIIGLWVYWFMSTLTEEEKEEMGVKLKLWRDGCGRKWTTKWAPKDEPAEMNFGFISRHEPTLEQEYMLKGIGINITHMGDVDAFHGDLIFSIDGRQMDGVIVVHPVLAMRYRKAGITVGVFENINRAKEGDKPSFGVGGVMLFSGAEKGTYYHKCPGCGEAHREAHKVCYSCGG
jgi:hypothetical protein